MIWTLKVKLIFGLYAEESWEGTLEIDSTSTLDELHHVIQYAVGFDNDHLYEFYVSGQQEAVNASGMMTKMKKYTPGQSKAFFH